MIEYWHQGSIESFRILYKDADGFGSEVKWSSGESSAALFRGKVWKDGDCLRRRYRFFPPRIVFNPVIIVASNHDRFVWPHSLASLVLTF
jgi:hypothetical protein